MAYYYFVDKICVLIFINILEDSSNRISRINSTFSFFLSKTLTIDNLISPKLINMLTKQKQQANKANFLIDILKNDNNEETCLNLN